MGNQGLGATGYRFHTGHAFAARVFAGLQNEAVEDAPWSAIRALHEHERLFSKLAEKEVQFCHQETAAEYRAMAAMASTHSQALRDVTAARTVISQGEVS